MPSRFSHENYLNPRANSRQGSLRNGFKATTLPLQWLEKRKPARVSSLEKLDLAVDPRDAMSLLAASLGLSLVEDSKHEKWLDEWPKSVATANSRFSGITIDDHDGGQTQIEFIAWGDDDGDGIEDMLLLVANRTTGGAFKVYRCVTVTRRSFTAPLIILGKQ